jgi:hypothetical protein
MLRRLRVCGVGAAGTAWAEVPFNFVSYSSNDGAPKSTSPSARSTIDAASTAILATNCRRRTLVEKWPRRGRPSPRTSHPQHADLPLSLSGCWRFPAGSVAGKTVSLPRAPDEPARMRLAHRSRRTSGQMGKPGSGPYFIFTLRFPARQGKRRSQSPAVALGELPGEEYHGFAR